MKLRNLAISFYVIIAGKQAELEIVPFRFAKPYFVRHTENAFPNIRGFHLFWGPFHLWTMEGLREIFSVNISVQSNPFHGQSEYMPR